ncbi:toll/interleukin-1 receptor domain-containing protein [Polyangium jinanense]|uniref:Toll/interleukin-1 receptor domain-containing protein n=1 Tax=Polyangium jinanense TaxID=2829994 RepID=A0A9X3XI54_9BACT|nr:toll/interleukin-1 receptor domain-containing protein [Polyangium jinanense]MDC3989118.1 toll/interleukin-1 receptor domain-containing protein [Polyangium jinanense]
MASQDRDPSDYKPPQSAKELLDRYAMGERWFVQADLSGASLMSANLTGANLTGANLIRTDLTGANLRNGILTGANLWSANLTGANLAGASLIRTNLLHVNVLCAKLTGAILSGANLIGADLSGTHLTGADLVGANFQGAYLTSALFERAKVGFCVLSNVDLSALCKSNDSIIHAGPSFIDFHSIVRSARAPRLEDFLMRAGLPSVAALYMIEAAQAVSGSIFDMMRSTFISYGSPDEAFARQLYEALHKNGVRVFLFSEHAEPGEKLHRMMRKGVNEHDRVILVCSKRSLDRDGVLNEIELTLGREAREGGETLLIPIRLDNYVFKGWKPKREDLAEAVRERVVADFEGADTDPAKFARGLSQLLGALRIKAGPPAPSGPPAP